MNIMKNMIAATAVTIAAIAPLSAGAIAAPSGLLAGNSLHADGKAIVIQAKGKRYHGRRHSKSTPVIDRRIARQSGRIARGRALGRLTRLEAVRLKGRLFAVRSARRFAKFDGRVTRTERLRLNRMLDRSSSRIRRLARNGRRS